MSQTSKPNNRGRKGRILRPLVASVSAILIAGMLPGMQASAADPDRPTQSAGTSSTATPTVAQSTATPADASPTADPGAVAGLDVEGKTIPRTNYAIPAGAIYMSTTGNDSNAGTNVNAPVKSLNRAIEAVPANGTIVVRGGTHREGFTRGGPGTAPRINTKPVTIQAYPNEQPWFDGSDVVPANRFTQSGSGWSIDWSTPTYCDGRYYERAPQDQNPNNSGPCAHIDFTRSGEGGTLPSDPQQAFVDGVEQVQVDSLSGVRPGTFYYDWNARKLHLGTNPSGRTIELTSRSKMIIFGGGSEVTRWALKGVGVRRYASASISGLAAGAVYSGSRIGYVENSVFTQNAAAGLVFDAPKDGSKVTRSIFTYNGDTPLGANGESRAGRDSNFIVENNVFNGNIWSNLGVGCDLSCGQAGVKLAHMQKFRMTGNLVQNNGGEAGGLWCDLLCRDGIYTYNTVRNIKGSGIFHEVSDTGIIAGNVVDRAKTGIQVASANTKVYNNTILNIERDVPIQVYDDNRVQNEGGWTDIGPAVRNVQLQNNLIAGARNRAYTVRPDGPYNPGNSVPADYFSAFNFNSAVSAVNDQVFVSWRPSPSASEEFYRARQKAAFNDRYGWERQSVWRAGTVQDVVPGATSGDYRVADNSITRLPNRPALPQDVADALGVAPNSLPLSGAPVRG